jgi:glycosyltransferase involved in cell wall biosynthesis
VAFDIECLKKSADVLEFPFGLKKGFHLLFRMFQLSFWMIKYGRNTQAIYLWFADSHGLIPAIAGRILGIKIITFIGGYDAVAIPELKYGAHLNSIRSFLVRIVCRFSNVLIPSSDFTGNQLIQTLHLPDLKKKIQVAYPGIDATKFQINSNQTRSSIIYVAGGSSENRMLLKGVDRFLELAKSMSETQFYLVGIQNQAFDWAQRNASNNVEILPNATLEKLNELFNLSAAICLFSRNEAFGMVVIEGMLCGCVPVILNNTGTVEILSKENAPGLIYSDFNKEEIAKDLNKVLKSHTIDVAEEMRKYVIKNFANSNRCDLVSSFVN